MRRPGLSVIMPNYNYGRYIGEALEAIASQSYAPDEMVIVDDCSTDNSVNIINGFLKKFPFMRLIRHERNRGVLESFNTGIQNTSGDYICLAASDDKVLPGFFEKTMALLKQYPGAGLCFSDWAMIEGEKVVEIRAYLSDKPRYFSPEEFKKILLRNEYTVIGGATVIAKRSDFLDAGGYLMELKAASDIFVNHVISFRRGACYVPEINIMLRKHENQYSSKKFRPLTVEMEMVRSMMDILLKPEYADVLPMFQSTAPFSHRSWDVLKLVIREKKYRGFFSLKLLRFALFDRFIRRLLLPILPMRVWRVLLGQYRKMKFMMGAGGR